MQQSSIIKKIEKLCKDIYKLNKHIFPIECGIYARPNSSIFTRDVLWNFIGTDGYLSSKGLNNEHAGCPLIDFDDDVKKCVFNILKNKLIEILNKKIFEYKKKLLELQHEE